MKKFILYSLAIGEVALKWIVALVAAIACVVTPYGIPIAVGFMAVTACTYVADPYLKVITAAGGSIVAMWLVLNAAEIAIVFTAFTFKKLIDRYVFHLDRQLEGAPITIPIPLPGVF